MNCCDEFGRCHCGMGIDRSGCAQATPKPSIPLRLAPGVIHTAGPTLQDHIKKRHRQALKRALLWYGAVMLIAFLGGFASEVWK